MDTIKKTFIGGKGFFLACFIIVFGTPLAPSKAYGQVDVGWMSDVHMQAYNFVSVTNTTSQANTITINFLDNTGAEVARESNTLSPGAAWTLAPSKLAPDVTKSTGSGPFYGSLNVSSSGGDASIMPWGAGVFQTSKGLAGLPFSWNSSEGVPYQPEKAKPVTLYELLSATFEKKYSQKLKAVCPTCEALINKANKARRDYIDLKNTWNVDALKHAISTLQIFEQMTQDQWEKAIADDEITNVEVSLAMNEEDIRTDSELAAETRNRGDDASGWEADIKASIEKNTKLRRKLKKLQKKHDAKLEALRKEVDKWQVKLDKNEKILRKIWRAKKEMDAAMASAKKCMEKYCGQKDKPSRCLDPATADQMGAADISLIGKDKASGNIFDATIKNDTGTGINICFSPGWAMPQTSEYQRMVITEGKKVTVPPGGKITVPLSGFCADPKKFPPPKGNSKVYTPPTPLVPPEWVKIPDNKKSEKPKVNKSPAGVNNSDMSEDPFLKEFLHILDVPRVVKEGLKNGKIPPTGLPPAKEQTFLTQWSFWNIFDNFNREDGKRKIESQVRKSGGQQTPGQIDELNKNIWEGIDLVKKEIREGGTN